MPNPIATAPKTGELVSLYEELGGRIENGRWSSETGNWTGPQGEPLRIAPTHWVRIPNGTADHRTARTSKRRRRVLIVCTILAGLGLPLGFASLLQMPDTTASLHEALTRALGERWRSSSDASGRRPNLVYAQLQQTRASPDRAVAEDSNPNPNEHRASGLESFWEQLRASLAAQKAAQSEADKAMQALAVKSAEHEKEITDKIEMLGRELASAREQLQATQAAETAARAEAEQGKQALSSAVSAHREQSETNEALARELASAREQLRTSQAAARKAEQTEEALSATTAELKKQSEQNEALARELASAREQLKASQAAAGKAEQTEAALSATAAELKRQSEQNESLARELAAERELLGVSLAAEAATRTEAERVKDALTRTVAEQKKQAEQVNALATDLAAAREQLKARPVTDKPAGAYGEGELRAAASENAQDASRPDRLASAGDLLSLGRAAAGAARDDVERVVAADAENVRRDLARLRAERSKWGVATGLKAEDAARHENALRGLSSAGRSGSARALEPAGMAPEAPSASLATAAVASASHDQSGPDRSLDDRKLLARAEALLRQGDIVGARILLEHTLEKGSARAAFMLAETHDERMLRTWGTYGIRADNDKARELYARAAAAGVGAAKERLQALSQGVGGSSR